MTTNDSRSPEALHDKGIVESLLAEAGINDPADAGLLTPALMSIRGLARGPHPVPSGELAALLAGLNAGTTVGPGSGAVSSLEAHRTKRRTRLVIAAAALSFSLGAGAAAAVASPDFRDAMHSTVSTLVQTLASSGSADRPGTPVPDSTPDSDVSVPATPATASAKQGVTGQATPPVSLPPSAGPQTGENVQHRETDPGLITHPVIGNPARPAPETPLPAAPAQPAESPATSAPAPQRRPLPEPPPAASAAGNHK